ncbi:MAG TPA: B12-binding domain-containing radical SAM protein [Syntrophobacteraceae bacterium]|nr:B12-binding domain-containing radical SAM protein [Syntrophobacteraceae bacterium]
MKILFVYPMVSETFWSFKHALRVVRRKAAFPPLGALTVAAMLPAYWEKRLVDLNARELRDADLLWADYVFISAMIAQKNSARQVVDRCRRLGARTVGGGPLFRVYPDDFADVDHLVFGEAETIIGELVRDMETGRPKKFYRASAFPALDLIPVPLWDLINLSDYASMSIQYSRGCPFNCEFCDIIVMNGRAPRLKRNEQVLAELEALYSRGWRGSVFIVDDNFIGNTEKVKSLLRAIILWQKDRPRRLNFLTEASVNLAEDPELMDLMVQAGFNKVFLGLETPVEEGLRECGKAQNLRRGLSESVVTIQQRGLAVMGGFIIGFDSDPPDVFQRQVNFIQKNGIVTAMIGLLTAIPGTRLYSRLESEGRMLFKASGDNTDVSGSLNFVTRMDRTKIIEGYRWVMNSVYSPEMYYNRILAFLRTYKPKAETYLQRADLLAFVRSLWYLGIADHKSRNYYWKLLKKAFSGYNDAFGDIVTYAIYGYHFRKLFWSPKFPLKLEEWLSGVKASHTNLLSN